MEFSQATINSVGLLTFGGTMTFVMAWFWYSRAAAVKRAEARAAELETVMARLSELETKERVAAQTMSPIVTAFQALLIKSLTHADHPEIDELLTRVGPPDVLTSEERVLLMTMLETRANTKDPKVTKTERGAAQILPVVMQMVAEEQAHFTMVDESKDLKLVTIVSVVGTSDPPEVKREGESKEGSAP